MKPLTPKQQAFADAMLCGAEQSAAYRLAFDTHGSPTTVAKNASRLRQQPNVAAYIASEQAKLAKKRILTRERSLEVLTGIAERKSARDSDKIHAIKTAAEMQGYNQPTKIEVKVEGSLLWQIRQKNTSK